MRILRPIIAAVAISALPAVALADQADEPAPAEPAQAEPAPAEPTQAEPAQPDDVTQTDPTQPDDATQAEPAQPDDATQAEPAQPESPVFEFLPSQCAADDIAAVRGSAESSIALIEAPGGLGLGFVYPSPKHVVTSLSLVDRGRGIRVWFGGKRRDASVVASDQAHDIAILELDSAAPGEPLTLAPSRAEVGDPMLALGVSRGWGGRQRRHHSDDHREGGDLVIHPGTVSFADGDRQRTNALAGRNLSWGGPLLDCEGRVLGVATQRWGDELASVARVRALADDVDGYYRSGWSLRHPSLGLVYQFDHGKNPEFGEHDRWFGGSIGTALIGHDRWYFPVRFQALWLIGPDYDSPLADRRGYRLGGHAALGYRFMLKGGTVPVYLVPTVGGGVWYQRVTVDQTLLSVDGPCDGPNCAVAVDQLRTTRSTWRGRPTASMGLQIGFGEASYQFQLDTERLSDSVHAFTLGAQW